MAGSYESRQLPWLFARHSCPCCERSGIPSLYRLSQDYLRFAVVSWSANQIARSTHLLNPERTGGHASDPAHSPGDCRVMASRTECKARGCRAHQKGCHKAFHKTLRLLQTFGYNHEQGSLRGFVSRFLPGHTSEIYPTPRPAASESWRQ